MECIYCHEESEFRRSIMEELCTLPYSTVYVFRSQTYYGRCVVAFRLRHVNELFELTAEERQGYMDDVARIATRAAVLHKGRLAMLGTPREIFSRGDELAAMGLDVPQTVQLCQALRAGGMDVPDCLTNEELCDAICRALGKEAAAHA